MQLTRAAALLILMSTACIIVTDEEGDTESASATDAETSMDPTSATSSGATTASSETASGSTSVADSGSGDSGSTGDPGPTANERCGPLCEALVGADCGGGLTTEGCMLTCESLTSSSACDPTAHEYFDCVDGAEVTCNAAGDVEAAGCGVAYLAAIFCAVTENPNPAAVEPCQEHCGLIAELECPGNGAEDDCNTNCLWLGNTGTGCDDEWLGYVDCFAEAERSCLLGFAVGEGCGPAFDAYTACVNE